MSSGGVRRKIWVQFSLLILMCALMTWVPGALVVAHEHKKQPAQMRSGAALGLGYCLIATGVLFVAGLAYAAFKL
jgi:hypothetical protein